MGISYNVLGILLMLDICFITNFFVIHALRHWTNVRASRRQFDDDEEEEEDQSSGSITYNASLIETILFGWVFGTVKPDLWYPRRFHKWSPIPWYIGINTTCILIIISLAFLTPEFLYNEFGVKFTGGYTAGNLCNVTSRKEDLISLNMTLKKMMNFDNALDQSTILTGMNKAMQSDVALYGTKNFTCPATTAKISSGNEAYALTGNIKQWIDESKRYEYPAVKWGTFFPGYCRAYHDSEIKISQLEICGPREICQCPNTPNTAPLSLVGLGGKKVCAMKVCFKFDNVPCGDMADYSIYQSLLPPNDYRTLQFQRAQELLALDKAKQEFPTSANDLNTKAVETFHTLLSQIDLANNLYAIYACISLYFPSPLYIFHDPYHVVIKQFFFGANKAMFIIFVVTLWWLFSYSQKFLADPDIHLTLTNLNADPCYLDAEYIMDRRKILDNLCTTLLSIEQDFPFQKGTANSILNEVEFFVAENPNGCNCPYPLKSLRAFNTSMYPEDLMEELKFTRTVRTIENVFLPSEGLPFLGNSSICNDFMQARKIVMQAPDSDMDSVSVWFASGLLAAIIIKFTVAKFVISLLKIADPLTVCNGEFFWIPRKFNLQLDSTNKERLFANFRKTTEDSQFYINFRGFLFWGIVMHLALFNLMLAGYQSAREKGMTLDKLPVAKSTIIVAILVLFMGCLIILCLKRHSRKIYIEPEEIVFTPGGDTQTVKISNKYRDVIMMRFEDDGP